MKAKWTVLLVCATLCAQEHPRQQSGDDPWQSLRFLIGTWEARTQGGSAGASSNGTYAFQLELRDHVVVRHSVSAACKAPASFDCEHTDLLYIYRDPSRALKAIYFDNEGHTIQYDVTTPEPNTVVFLSPATTAGPQFRLAYILKGSGMEGKFQMRMPGQTEFKSYLEWTGGKK